MRDVCYASHENAEQKKLAENSRIDPGVILELITLCTDETKLNVQAT